jgi:hypothetical protein
MEVKMKTKFAHTYLLFSLGICILLISSLLSACSLTTEVEAAPQPTNTPIIEFESNPTPMVEPEPEAELPAYTDDEYQLSFTYPADWSFEVSLVGQAEANSRPASHLVELANGNYATLIHIKYYWDNTIIGGGMPPGEVQQDGKVTLLGQSIDRNQLNYQDAIKMVWYGGRFDDLELYILIKDKNQDNYESIAIPESLTTAVEEILASFIRTGEPVRPPKPTPTAQIIPDVCSLPTLINVNDWAVVTPGLPNVVRSAPGRGPDSTILGQITAGTIVHALEGPVCASGYYWWKVDTGMISGWTAEGGDGVYWLSQVANDEAVLVDGWVGTIISTPEWPQIDDYFQMLDQGGSKYGISSLDPTVRQQLEAYRDKGTLLRIWGRLYYDRMDAFNTQIEVVRFEEYQPSNDEPAQSVEDWWGVVVSNPPGAQFDDYFQMMDQNGTRYGIDSLDPVIQEQLIHLRDTAQVIRVWGVLNLDVPDAYGGQIQVDRLELAP